ncbi:MAG: elongation factor P [Bdellovibrionales bacterium]|nr:elongation factor P [Bdellovibrionales bacterium]
MKASLLRKGNVVIHNKQPYKIMEAIHSTPGNLRAKMQTKMRNLINGTQTEVRFSATEDVEEADVFTQSATFLYSDVSGYHFMNSVSFEQVTISPENLGSAIYYLQESMEIKLTLWEGSPIDIELPSSVVLEIEETEPELRGATASNSPKPAKTTTGLQLSVPPFLKIGDKVLVNTSDGSYISRAND